MPRAARRRHRRGAASATGQAGEATIRIDGPTTIVLGNVVPPKFPATITFTYTGPIPPTPPGSQPSQVRTRFTLTLTNHMHSMETSIDGAADGCASASGPLNFWGPRVDVAKVRQSKR